MSKTNKEIIQKLATKYKLSLAAVEEVVNSQFKYTSEIMSGGNFEAVRLPYFGRFSSKKSRRDILTAMKQKKDGLTDTK